MQIGKYIKISPWRWWVYCWQSKHIAGVFRNDPRVIPGRWGFYLLGLEVGSRNPGDPVGLFLIRNGLWPW